MMHKKGELSWVSKVYFLVRSNFQQISRYQNLSHLRFFFFLVSLITALPNKQEVKMLEGVELFTFVVIPTIAN